MLQETSRATTFAEPRPAQFDATIAYAKTGQTNPVWAADEMTMQFETARVRMTDAHSLPHEPTLEREGFMLSKLPSKVKDFEDASEIETTYFDEITEHVKELTGASKVLVYPAYLYRQTNLDANWSPRKMPAGQGAHIDFTESAARDFLASITDADEALARYSRIAIYQTWRALSGAPLDLPLAATDGRSVARADLVKTDTRLPKGTQPVTEFEFLVGMAKPEHRWYYFRDMEPDDLFVFQGYDFQNPGELNVLHTGFVDETAFGIAKPRKSIELRTFAFFD